MNRLKVMIEQFNIFKPHSESIIAGFTTKEMGSFNDSEEGFDNQLSELEKISPNPIFSNQMHGDKIIVVEKNPINQFKADAFLTQKTGITLAIKVADCQGIVMYDPVTKSIAAVHAGWRGVALTITGKTIRRLKKEFNVDPKNILVGISPSLGPCCAEFSDPTSELPTFMKPYIKNKYVDLWSAVRAQLIYAGIPDNQIEMSGECTKCNPDKYFSHRNKDLGRMAVFIGLK